MMGFNWWGQLSDLLPPFLLHFPHPDLLTIAQTCQPYSCFGVLSYLLALENSYKTGSPISIKSTWVSLCLCCSLWAPHWEALSLGTPWHPAFCLLQAPAAGCSPGIILQAFPTAVLCIPPSCQHKSMTCILPVRCTTCLPSLKAKWGHDSLDDHGTWVKKKPLSWIPSLPNFKCSLLICFENIAYMINTIF